jgi:hypothetical protein
MAIFAPKGFPYGLRVAGGQSMAFRRARSEISLRPGVTNNPRPTKPGNTKERLRARVE